MTQYVKMQREIGMLSSCFDIRSHIRAFVPYVYKKYNVPI